MAPTGSATLPQRSDARRNRLRVLEGAREAFAEAGLSAQMDDVAARAGVGIGTVYRHFPNKEAVIEALADEHFDALAADAEAAPEEPDAWEAFVGWLKAAAARQASDRALAEIMSSRPTLLHETVRRRADVYAVVGRLVERAQAAGALRADLQPEDVPVLLCGVASAAHMAGRDAPESRERYLRLVLDGMRAPSG
jgi:AcrR family transcriptional regulator